MSEETTQETQNQEQQEQEQQVAPDLASILSAYDGAPDKAQIEQWKQEYGEIFCSGFSETELFVWRTLRRKEWTQLQNNLRNPELEEEVDVEEQVVKTCVLWASDYSTLAFKAGSVSTISEQIMLNSNFMAPAIASSLVIKL